MFIPITVSPTPLTPAHSQTMSPIHLLPVLFAPFSVSVAAAAENDQNEKLFLWCAFLCRAKLVFRFSFFVFDPSGGLNFLLIFV